MGWGFQIVDLYKTGWTVSALSFLDMTLSLLEALVGFTGLRLDGTKFNLKLTDTRLKLGHGVTSTLGSNFIGLSQSQLNLINLGFKSTLGFALSSGMILLSPELICKASSINHGSLGLFFRTLSLGKHVINLSMESMNSRFQAALVRGSLGVDGVHVVDRATSFNQFHVSLFLATVSRVQKSPRFLKFIMQGLSSSISQSSLLSKLTTLAGLILIENLNLTKLSLEPLD